MVRYGIIGVGAMGREHAENLRYIDGAAVTAISDPDEPVNYAVECETCNEVIIDEEV